VQGTTVFAERIVSPHAPTLVLAPPIIDDPAQTIALSWNASDADADPLQFDVQYSADDGATWMAVQMDYPWMNLVLDTRRFPGSAQARLRVLLPTA